MADDFEGFVCARFWLAADNSSVLGTSRVCSVQYIRIGYSSAQCIEIGFSSAQCIKIGYSSAQCIKIGYSSAQCIKVRYSSTPCIKIGIGLNDSFSALWDFFAMFPWTPPRGLIMTPAVNFCASGYCFDLMQCGKILLQCIKIGYISVMFWGKV